MTTTIVNRGTLAIKLEACPSKSAGVLFQKCQAESMTTLPPTTVISTKRGTARMIVSEYPKVESKIPNWGVISVARGTGVRTL